MAAGATVVLVGLGVRTGIATAAGKATTGITALVCSNWAAQTVDTQTGLTLGATDATVVGVFIGINTLATTIGEAGWTLSGEGSADATER